MHVRLSGISPEKKLKLRKQVRLWSNMAQLIPLLFIPSIPFCRYLCENFKHLSIQMIQLPVLLVEGGISPGLVGRLSWQCSATAKNHRNVVIVQGWKTAHDQEGTNKRCITMQQTKPFHMKSVFPMLHHIFVNCHRYAFQVRPHLDMHLQKVKETAQCWLRRHGLV